MKEKNDITQEKTENLCVETTMEQQSQDNETAAGFWKDNRGVGVIEIVLILVILIGLVLVFKDQITAIVNNAFAAISGDAGKILN